MSSVAVVVDGSGNPIVATITNQGGTNPSVSGTWPPTGVNAGDRAIYFGRMRNISLAVTTPKTGGVNWIAEDGATYIYERIFSHDIVAGEAIPTLGTNSFQSVTIFFVRWTAATPPTIGSTFAGLTWDSAGPATNIAFSAQTPPKNGCLPLLFGAFSATVTSVAAPVGYSTLILEFSGSVISTIVASAAQQGTATTIAAGSCTVTGGGSSNFTISAVATVDPGTPTSAGVSITSVSPTTIHPGDTGVVINGSFPGSGDTVTLIDRNNTIVCTVTADTTTAITVTIPGFAGLGGVCFGSSLQIQVANGSNTATKTGITLAPTTFGPFIATPQAIGVQALKSLLFANQLTGQATPSRLTTSSGPDIANNSQVLIGLRTGSLGTHGIALAIDGTPTLDIAVTGISFFWNPNTGTGDAWSAQTDMDTVAPFPFRGAAIADQTWTQNSAISPTINASTGVVEPDSTALPLVYSISPSGNALPAGVSIGSSTGIISGTPTSAGATTNIIVRITDAYASYYELPGFTATVVATGPTFSGTIPNPPQLTVGVAMTPIATASFFTNVPSAGYSLSAAPGSALPAWLAIDSAGTISGTPTNAGVPAGGTATFNVVVTGTNGSLSAASNAIAFTVFYPATTAVPDFSSGTWTQAAVTSSLTAAGLNGSFPVSWPGSLAVLQSTPGGQVVPLGTTITVGPQVTFSGTVGAQSYTAGTAITPLNVGAFFTWAISYDFDANSDDLPDGLALDTTTGIISGTPTGLGIGAGSSQTYNIIIDGRNSLSPGPVASNTFIITVSVLLSTVLVPDVSSGNPSQASAAATLVAAGLGVAVTNQTSATVFPGDVISQSIAPNTPVSPGTVVTITVAVVNFGALADALYPSLQGITFDIIRTPVWNTGRKQAVSGKLSRIAYQAHPLIHFELSYNILDDSIATSDLKALAGLLNAMFGRGDTFLFTDPDFNTVTQQSFATSNGSTITPYQITAVYGNSGQPSYTEIIQNFNGIPQLYDNGSLISPATYTLSPTGLVQFSISPPSVGHTLSWSGQFYYRCRFDEDAFDWTKRMYQIWAVSRVKFTSILL